MSLGRPLLFALVLAAGCGGKKAPVTPPSGADAASLASHAETASTISGTVVGVDGKPPAVAHVRVLRMGDGEPDEATIDPDGKFELATKRRGLVLLEVTAVDHAQWRLPIVVTDAPVTMDIELGTYVRNPGGKDAGVLVWEGDPDKTPPKRHPLEHDDSGRMHATIATKAGEIQYQLEGLSPEGRTFNGPQASRYEYDGGGDYRSVLVVEGGKVELSFHPDELAPSDAPAKVTFGEGAPHLQRIAAFDRLRQTQLDGFAATMQAMAEKDPYAAQRAAQEYPWTHEREALMAAIEAEKDPMVRRVMAAGYFGLGNFDADKASAAERGLAAELLADMDGKDPAWLVWPEEMAKAVPLSDDPADAERFEELVATELPPQQGAGYLLERLVEAELDGRDDDARRYYAMMTSERFKSTPMAMFAKQFDPDRPIREGKALPAFEFGALPNKKGKVARKFGNEDLQGTVYLLDFWATWCGPCVADMPNLHAAYDKFGAGSKQGKRRKGRKFEILSVSVDGGAEVVHDFRANRFPMPWQHAHVPTKDAAQIFGFSGIPFAVLVDEKGTILAATPQLNAQSLEPMLAGILDAPASKP